MSTPTKQKLTIERGRTYRLPVQWESELFAYSAISAITAAAPCRVTTTDPHGIPDGWRVAVVSARGMTEINASDNPPVDADYRRATLLSANQIEFNRLNAADFSPYTSGGYLQYRVPVDLTGFSARMTIRDKVGGLELLSLTTENGRILIDNTKKTVTLLLTASDTSALTWKSGVFDLEMVSSTGEVTALMVGSVAVLQEVTT